MRRVVVPLVSLVMTVLVMAMVMIVSMTPATSVSRGSPLVMVVLALAPTVTALIVRCVVFAHVLCF